MDLTQLQAAFTAELAAVNRKLRTLVDERARDMGLTLSRARLRLQSGMIDGAIGEVQNLPGGETPTAKAWIADADRYSKAMKALDRIEHAAILDPRQLRDAAGKQVEQPSPIAAPPKN